MPEMWLANVVCLHRARLRAGSLQTHISMPALRASKDCRCQIRRGSGEPFITSCSLLNQKDGHAAVSPKSDQVFWSGGKLDHRLGLASLMAGFIAPLPFQPSPFSSSKAKQLGCRPVYGALR